MTGAHRPSEVDGNGIPRPIVKWRKASVRPRMLCDTCGLDTAPADLALARLHVKTYPDHTVTITTATRVAVWAETKDGTLWGVAVNGQ